MARDLLDDFTRTTFTFGGKERTVYRQGSGTAVIVMAEIPGITPAVASFARRVVARGHTVYLPHLFGDPGAEMTTAGVVRAIVPACVSREFQAFALRTTPPAIDWLRALARQAHAECGGPGRRRRGDVLHRRVRAGDVDRARDARSGPVPAVAPDRARTVPEQPISGAPTPTC